MKELLFLVHRIPYPPNKGDKIRSFNILKHLCRSYFVHLGTFIDDPHDFAYTTEIQRICKGEACFLPLHPRRAKLRSLRGFLTGDPLSLPYYRDERMWRWTQKIFQQHPIDIAFVFSSAMAQYVPVSFPHRRLIDFVDVDSDKWRQYADRTKWPFSSIYRREGLRLLAFDRMVASRFDRSLFVSAHEAALFKHLVPEAAQRISHIENGVDTDYFSDSTCFVNPFKPGEEALVFTGMMDYWANVDAVSWFATQIFPRMVQRRPSIRFYIVGARPSEAVLSLSGAEGVVVTGAVKDVRPYLAHARLAVAPLRIARGVQNKVLEAMAMSRSVVATAQAVEGIDIRPELDIKIADTPNQWIETLSAVLHREILPQRSTVNRRYVQARYSWERSLSPLTSFLEE
jgi:sugar transferase (PEP-CTERM/EpsH1 system associated)